MNLCIITARAGSKSIPNKNVVDVSGHPLISYPIRAAQGARLLDLPVYVSTDGALIAHVAKAHCCKIIDRPEELRGDDVNHGDVIKHAVHIVREKRPEVENIVLLLGNTVMLDSMDIDNALDVLARYPDATGVMTVWRAADDHPLRALEVTTDGYLEPYGGGFRDVSTARQSYPPAFYYDQGVWAFRAWCVDDRTGPNPWWWMGPRVLPIIREWCAGRDIHNSFDVEVARWWLRRQSGLVKEHHFRGVGSQDVERPRVLGSGRGARTCIPGDPITTLAGIDAEATG